MSASDHLQPQQMNLFLAQAPYHTWVDDEHNEQFARQLAQARVVADQLSWVGRAKTSLLNRASKKSSLGED